MAFRVRMGIRAWLVTLVLVASLPLLGFAVWAMAHMVADQKAAVVEAVARRAETSSTAVIQRLQRVHATLDVLAQSDAALSGDLGALYAHARRLLPVNPDITAIALIGPEGQQIFNTLQPFGRELPPSGDIVAAKMVFETGRPAISGPFKGTVSNAWVMSMGVPVVRDGKVAYCLRMILPVDAITTVMVGRDLPDDWITALVNAQGTIVSRTLSPETTIGTKVSKTLGERLSQGLFGVYDGVTKEGVHVITATVRLQPWDWAVAVSVPRDILDAPLRKWATLVGTVATLLLGLTNAAAWWLASHLSRQVRLVSMATRALGEGVEHDHAEATVHELAAMGKAIASVKQRETRNTLALADALVENQQVRADLASARHDPLTGLPSRALFFELANGQGSYIVRSPDLSLSLMFIDLDGFKQVNDRLGHERGDQVLAETAAILRATVRESDAVGRLGGDEFAICLTAPNAAIEEVAANVAGRIVERVREIGDGIGCSIGICLCPPGFSDVPQAIKGADEAMYEAKRAGKNRFAMRWLIVS